MSTLGETLVAARRALGLSVTEISERTKVRSAMIEALERGDYEVLPAPAYVRGYILAYASLVDLDSKPLLDMYVAETGTATRGVRVQPPTEVVRRGQQLHAVPMRTAVIIAVAVLVIFAVLWMLGRARSEPSTPLPIASDSTTTSTEQPSTDSTLPGVVSTETLDEDSPANDILLGESFTLSVSVDASAASWLRVTVDGLLAYEGTLAGGQSKEWEVASEAVVRIGKPEFVTIERDGQVVEIPRNNETPTVTLRSTD